jgi:transcriptional regulator with AAA-type ATPase domain
MKSATTLDGTSSHVGESPDTPTRPALVLLWSATEPARVGEVLLIPEGTSEFGRGDEGESAAERVSLVRQRPGANEKTAALESPFLSRTQLRFEVKGLKKEELAIENVGKRAMLVDGTAAGSAVVTPGQTVEIKSQLLFLCVRRPDCIPPLANVSPPRAFHPFGDPDAHGLVGESPAAWQVRDQLALLAACSPHVLLLGESGTGKELAAQAVHAMSARAAKKLVARNAATVPSGLIDAELFGNVANYPNPGMPERAGLIGEADGGTLFLDEIGELPSELQAHLLRVLDERGEYQRLGDARPRRADVRLVAATNRPVDQLKHDLAARLALRMTLPGLDERRDDIPLLVRHVLRRRARKDAVIASRFFGANNEPRVSVDLMRALVTHAYSTHVRELEGLLWQAVATSRGGSLELTDAVAADVVRSDDKRAVPAIEIGADAVRAALAKHNGVQEKVWRELGLANRYVLKRLMKKYGIKAVAEAEAPE